LVLTVRAPTAKDTAAIAAVWADVLAERGNEIYGSSEEDVSFLEAQFAQSKRALDEADAAVIEFQARNRTSILAAQLASLEETQQRYLTETIKIALLTQEIEDLQAQIGRQSAEGQAPPGASLTALLLQIRAYNAEATSSVLLEVRDDGALLDTTVAEQVKLLDDLAATLEARAAEIDARLAGLEPRQLALQRELQVDATELARLLREQELADETYATLVRKLDEARIAAEEEDELLQVGSYPSMPTEPASRGGILAAAAGGLLGFLAGVVIVLVVHLIEERPGARPAAGSS
jgi:capsule polysaccharide export protein KpsE/RkpR